MSDIIYNEFVDDLNYIDNYFEEVNTNYIESVETIILEGGPYVRQRLQYLNEQAEEKEKKGLAAVIQKFVDFIKKLTDKIKEIFMSEKAKKLKSQIEDDKKMKQMKVSVTDPKAFDKYIALRNQAADRVIAKLKRAGNKVTKKELDDMIDDEFRKIDAKRTAIIGGAVLIPIGFLVAAGIMIANPFTYKYKKYEKECKELLDKYEKSGSKQDLIKLHKATDRKNENMTMLAMTAGGAAIIAPGYMTPLISKILNHVSATAKLEFDYRWNVNKIITRAVSSKNSDIVSDD